MSEYVSEYLFALVATIVSISVIKLAMVVFFGGDSLMAGLIEAFMSGVM